MTMGSEVMSNLIVCILFVLKADSIKLKKNYLYFVLGFLMLFIPIYFLTFNDVLLRFIIYIPRFIIIKVLIEEYLAEFSENTLKGILQNIFLLHCTVIILCFLFPPFNSFLDIVLNKYYSSDYRISGFFSGYDIISFFTVFYLYVDYRCNNYKFTRIGYLQLFLGFSATVVTGRFGLVLYLVFLSYIFFRNINFTKTISFLSICSVLFFLFFDRIFLLYNTFLLIRDSLDAVDPDNTSLSLEDYGSEGQEGFYQLSPLVLYREMTMPFTNISNFLIPSINETIVDSGPSFVVLNIGLFMAICLYLFYFKIIYKGIDSTVFFTIIILIMDIKFRILLVLMPTIWILVNLERLKKHNLQINQVSNK